MSILNRRKKVALRALSRVGSDKREPWPHEFTRASKRAPHAHERVSYSSRLRAAQEQGAPRADERIAAQVSEQIAPDGYVLLTREKFDALKKAAAERAAATTDNAGGQNNSSPPQPGTAAAPQSSAVE